MTRQNKIKRLNYKWIIISLCFLMIFITLGFCSSPKSLFLDVITEELNIERSLFSLNDTFRYVATAIVNLFFGALIQKFGAKKLIIGGFLFLCASMIIYSIAENLIAFYIAGAFLGIGFSWTGTTMVGCIVNRWCPKNKGTIMGLILAANGLGGALAIQILSPIIESGDSNYRIAYRIAAAVILVTGIVMAIFMREAPRDNTENRTVAVNKGKKRGDSWPGIDYSRISGMPLFYVSLVCLFLTGFCLQGITGIAKAHMRDVGIGASYVAFAMSFHSISLSVFKFLTGLIYDKFGLRITTGICSATASVVFLLLAFITDSTAGMVLAMIYSILSSLALPLETIMLPIYASDLFGNRSYEKVLGIFVSVNVTGYALGTPAVNLCFDLFGTYTPALLVAAAIMAAVTVTMQIIALKAHKLRDQI